nr:putative ribonuclease H-like domain-containing protein [Tanacetum cinerariifolium]
ALILRQDYDVTSSLRRGALHTQSMNYQPVVAGNQPNSSAGIQENLDVGKVGKENVSTQQYMLLPLWSTGLKDPQNTDVDVAFDVKENDTNRVNAASAPVTAVGPNSINSFNAAGPSNNAVSSNFEIGGNYSFMDPSQYPKDPDMPVLEDIVYSDDEEDEDGIDYEEVFAPVARIAAIRLFLAYASFMGFMVYQMDVKSAFLYGTIEEEVYVCQPPGFEDPDYPDKVYKVVKALYGLHQAPRAWYETLANYLLENGFQRAKIDQTLFIKNQKGDILLVQVYVDDIIFGSTNKELCKAFEKLMKDKFQMSSMGELTFFLGLQAKQKDNGIFIRQGKYVAEILRKFGLTYGKSASTTINTNKPLLKDPDGEDVDVHIYRHFLNAVSFKLMLFGLTIDDAHLMLLVEKSNDVVRLQALIDRKKVNITEDTIRQALRLDYVAGVDCLPNEEIFAELARMSDICERKTKKDKIGSKPDKNGKRGEAEKSQKQLQSIRQVKLKKTQKEGPEMQSHTSFMKERRKEGLEVQFAKRTKKGIKYANI